MDEKLFTELLTEEHMDISKSEAINILLDGKSVFVDGNEIRYEKSSSMIQCRSENNGHKWINSPFWLSNLLGCKKCEVKI